MNCPQCGAARLAVGLISRAWRNKVEDDAIPYVDMEIYELGPQELNDQHACYDIETIDSQIAFDAAEEHNLQVVLPADNELQLDIDGGDPRSRILNLIDTLEAFWGPFQWSTTPSRSGIPDHVHVTLRALEPGRTFSALERIALQACFGSDPKREMLSLARVLHNDPHPTLFLEKK